MGGALTGPAAFSGGEDAGDSKRLRLRAFLREADVRVHAPAGRHWRRVVDEHDALVLLAVIVKLPRVARVVGLPLLPAGVGPSVPLGLLPRRPLIDTKAVLGAVVLALVHQGERRGREGERAVRRHVHSALHCRDPRAAFGLLAGGLRARANDVWRAAGAEAHVRVDAPAVRTRRGDGGAKRSCCRPRVRLHVRPRIQLGRLGLVGRRHLFVDLEILGLEVLCGADVEERLDLRG